jgi:hypothetical protein
MVPSSSNLQESKNMSFINSVMGGIAIPTTVNRHESQPEI